MHAIAWCMQDGKAKYQLIYWSTVIPKSVVLYLSISVFCISTLQMFYVSLSLSELTRTHTDLNSQFIKEGHEELLCPQPAGLRAQVQFVWLAWPVSARYG